jgi:hypothetical protein
LLTPQLEYLFDIFDHASGEIEPIDLTLGNYSWITSFSDFSRFLR